MSRRYRLARPVLVREAAPDFPLPRVMTVRFGHYITGIAWRTRSGDYLGVVWAEAR